MDVRRMPGQGKSHSQQEPQLPPAPQHSRPRCWPCHPHRNAALAAPTRSPLQTRAVSLPTGADCCPTAAREGFSSPRVPPSFGSGQGAKHLAHLRAPHRRGAAPHADAKADCSGVFTPTRIKGSLTLRRVTSQQCLHGYSYATKSAGDLPSAFPCFVPSPAHLCPVASVARELTARGRRPPLKSQPCHQPGSLFCISECALRRSQPAHHRP